MRYLEDPTFVDAANLTYGVGGGGTIEAVIDGHVVIELRDVLSVDQAAGRVKVRLPPFYGLKVLVDRPS